MLFLIPAMEIAQVIYILIFKLLAIDMEVGFQAFAANRMII